MKNQHIAIDDVSQLARLVDAASDDVVADDVEADPVGRDEARADADAATGGGADAAVGEPAADDVATDDATPDPRRGSGSHRWTIRLRTTVLATVIFVVFGIAMALIARSAVVHLVTAQRADVAESALSRLMSSVGSPAEAFAVESDPSVHVEYSDSQGEPATYEEFMEFLGGLDEPLNGPPSVAVAGSGDGASSGAHDGATSASGTIVFGTDDTPPDGSVFESSAAAVGSEDEWHVVWTGETSASQASDGVTARAAISIGDSAMNVAVTAPSIGDALSVFDRTMILLIAALALVVAAMSWFSVSFALRPVEAIRRQVARTDPRDLSHHVPRPGSGDEIDRLAATMNELLDRLHDASIEQKRFVSDASHELRSPVTAALATIQTVDRSQMGPGWSEIETTLTDATVRLSTLIDDLFLMSTLDERRAAADQPSDDSHRADIETDLDEVALRIADRPHRRPVAVRVDRPVRVRADRRLIDRCVTNLVDNATRHAAESVLISVGVTDDGRPELVVTDDGPGIPAVHRETIFERFARLDQSRSADGGGAGLGLSIARQIADQYGAQLVLGDPSEADGAAFHLIFDQPVDEPTD